MNSRSNNNGHLDVPEDDAPPPPYTETDIYSNSGAGGSRSPHTMTSSQTLADDGASSTGDVIYTPPLSPHVSPSPHQPGAALYFESRPPPVLQQNSATRATIAHNVRVNNSSLPDDLPYQGDWAARDVTPQDWATFVNYLLPDHTTRGNEAILARKLQAEGRSDSSSMSSGVSQVEAQMGQIRDSAPGGSPNPAQRRRDIEATIQQWNDGFFGPRGINVHLEPPRDQQQQIPGAWSTSFDQREPAAPAQGETNRSGQGRLPGPGWRGWGDFHIDENSIRYGNNFVADQNGLRIGNLVMDQHGIRLQGDTSTPGQQSGVGGAGPSVGQPMSAPSSPYGQGFGHGQEREIRGRRIHHFEGGQGKDRRERSHSVSSDSSTSSSGSESSIGSLPDYDDIPQHAMPLYVSRLKDWTSHPEQLRKKEDVKRLRSELKSAAKSRNSQLNADKKALKAQIKSMTAEWKQIKKQQRKTRREGRKARREKRRAEKKERRQTKREMKRAHKEARRNSYPRPLPPGPPPPPWIPPLPPMTAGQSNPQMPPNPPQLPQSPYSSTPPVPPMPYNGGFPFGRGRGGRCCSGSSRGGGFFGSSSGAFGGRHPPFCGGNHGGDHGPFGPHGPFGEHGPFGSNGPFGAGGPFGPGGPFGSRGGGPSNSRSLPGSWPDEKKEAVVSEVRDDEIPPPGPVAAAKYRAMENIQAAIEQQTAAAEKLGPCPQRDGLELAIGKLLQNLDKLRIEADEAYAKDLMREAGGN